MRPYLLYLALLHETALPDVTEDPHRLGPVLVPDDVLERGGGDLLNDVHEVDGVLTSSSLTNLDEGEVILKMIS